MTQHMLEQTTLVNTFHFWLTVLPLKEMVSFQLGILQISLQQLRITLVLKQP